MPRQTQPPKEELQKAGFAPKTAGEALNPAQKAAIDAKYGPLLIVAGAGTGKTKTLTSRIIRLIDDGIPPERICSITFTNKAAKEMARRVNRKGPFLGTFHALGAKILRKECGKVGREPNFAIFDAHDSFDLVKKAVKEVLPPKKVNDDDIFPMTKRQRATQETPAYFDQKISEIKNLGMEAAMKKDPALSSSSEKRARVMRVFEKYEELLKKNNAFDFDDLIEKVTTLFKTHPEVLAKYQSMFDVILVDEYQDINPKQYELVSLLAREHRNLSVVGDDEQTIYSWRYADIATFLNFDKEWKGAAVHFLEENYRSTGTIIKAAAAVVKNNRFRTPKNLWTQNPDGEPITLFEAWGENDEAEWIAEQIKKIRAGDARADIGILYRTNAQSRAIEQALIRYNIPYRIFGGLKFYERKEVKDVVSALRYISNRKDGIAKERLEKNLTKRRFAEFGARVTAAGATGATGDAITPLNAIKIFLEAFNYFEYLEGNFLNADEREENITELIAFASEFTDLDALLERLSLLEAADEIGKKPMDQGREVNLMTIHLAKGLEFDSVFIAGAAEGFLPHGRSIENEAALEEERRLMYVAMTRARKKLSLSFYGIPSRFIGEIPEEFVRLEKEGGNGDDGSGHSDDNRGDNGDSFWEEENVVQFD
ncbi:MAG: UvrD-helicase domain-containing protein [Candidatus Pacebacteria bacterium]|nr:UvrD-helicase domain-containing protein [Candidatus Paceibacterota bacterium]